MKMLLNICKNTNLTERKYEYLFLLFNTLAWCVIGFAVWTFVSLFALKDIEWMVTFVGYFGLIPGFIGGVIEAWRNER